MTFNKGKAACALALCVFLFAGGMLTAQMNPITRFKKVSIPLDLRIEDSILPKGEYDLEFVRVPNPLAYYLRFMKKGKIMHVIQGKDLPYETGSKIPRKPVLKMSRNTAEKSLLIVFESGSDTEIYGQLRLSYRLEYKED